MFKNRLMALLSILSSVLLVTAACAAPAAHDLMAQVQAGERPLNPEPPPQPYRDAVADFSLKLLAETLDRPGNVLISPASVYFALAMTLNGASGETLEAMRAALSSAGLEEAQINQASRDWIALLEDTGDKTELFIANSIWLREGYPVAPAFLQRNADFFRASATALDFSLPTAPDTINDWVSKATRAKIDKIVEQIEPDVMMYLINAIYFKSDWQNPFEAAKTYDGPFQSPDGPADAAFMNRLGQMDLIEGEGVKGVWLPYTDPSYAFFAILPDSEEAARSWAAGLDGQTLAAWLNSRHSALVDLSLPKFELDYEISLVDALSQLGMAVAFTGGADFSRMRSDGSTDLMISEVKHKTYFRVDEKGSEAAAVTSVEMQLTSLPVYDKILRFDRPFLFGIADARSGLPVFIGLMEKPEA
ncbi:MAG: serine proteinase inhibitor [Clostridiaceae bacterium]|jgi:serpin B|nr:serine proteinase inhibitor [Clostridiaceae bacterium]